MNHEPTLAPGECVLEDYGNQHLIGPCPADHAALGSGLCLLMAWPAAGAGVWLYTEIDRRRQLYYAVIQSLEGEL